MRVPRVLNIPWPVRSHSTACFHQPGNGEDHLEMFKRIGAMALSPHEYNDSAIGIRIWLVCDLHCTYNDYGPTRQFSISIRQYQCVGCVCVCVFMALITTLVLCARSQGLVMSVSVRGVHVGLSCGVRIAIAVSYIRHLCTERRSVLAFSITGFRGRKKALSSDTRNPSWCGESFGKSQALGCRTTVSRIILS